MPMYKLIEFSDNCCDTSGSLGKFNRDEMATMQMYGLQIVLHLYIN